LRGDSYSATKLRLGLDPIALPSKHDAHQPHGLCIGWLLLQNGLQLLIGIVELRLSD